MIGQRENSPPDPIYRVQLALSLLVLTLSMWLSTGTLAPYGTTIIDPFVNACGYLFNSDHPQFVATFRLLNFEDPSTWSFSAMLRRILYPILAFPAMKWLGFETGGVLTNFVLHWACFIAGAAYFRKRFGRDAALSFMWLLSTFPGITYWVGMPYSHAAIIPCCILALMLLWEMAESESGRKIVLMALGIGAVCTAYDLFIFLGPATLLIVKDKRDRLRLAVPVGVALVLPQIAVHLLLAYGFGVGPGNVNSQIYSLILGSYLHPKDFALWWEMVRDFPLVLAKTYFYSGFVYLPAFFLVCYFLGRRRYALGLSAVERAILLASLLLYLFLNLAPPYLGWQMRGDWISRIYQPTFMVFLLYAARLTQRIAADARARRAYFALIAICVLGNGATVFGFALKSTYSERMYWNFYQHGPRRWTRFNLDKYGVRPYGFCRE